MNDNIDRYEILSEPDKRWYVMVMLLADVRIAPFKAAWLKPAPHNESPTHVMPRSRTKAIRMTMLDWGNNDGGIDK